MENEVLRLSHVNLTKNGKQVLKEFSLTIIAGDIMGLMNIDNMGLSALLDLLLFGGSPDSGRMYFCGREISGKPDKKNERPRQGTGFCGHRTNKISVIENQSHLIHSLNISDNFFFIKERSPFFVQKKKQLWQLRMIFKKYGLNLTGTEYPSDLTELERCRFELIKLAETGFRLIILKNISSFLNPAETEEVHALIKKIAAEKGTAFLYMSTQLSNFHAVCNVIAVMKDGTILYKKDSKSLMPGMLEATQKEFADDFICRGQETQAQEGREGGEIARIQTSGGLDISIKKGECLMLLDLDNRITGKICRALLDRKSAEVTVKIRGEDAFKNPALYSYIPENPRETAFFPHMSYIDNLLMKKTLYGIKSFRQSAKFFESVRREYSGVLGEMLEKQDLMEASQEELYNLLYQKIRIERPELVFINHPFDELDMMQRAWCFDAIREIQNRGGTVVIFDIRPSELLKSASRVLTVQGGKLTRGLPPENPAF